MPWGVLIEEVRAFCVQNIPKSGQVLDILCGTGNLLGAIKKERPDIACVGIDLESEYIAYAKSQYPEISFTVADAMLWKADTLFDAVLVTGGLHHLPYESQETFIAEVSKSIKPEGFAIIADPYIDDYTNEEERKVAAEKLGVAYIEATAHNHAPHDIVEATKTILHNDVLGVEYKTSLKKLAPVFEKYFMGVEIHKTWPNKETEYGDYWLLLIRPR